jgi:hypothetical protein
MRSLEVTPGPALCRANFSWGVVFEGWGLTIPSLRGHDNTVACA